MTLLFKQLLVISITWSVLYYIITDIVQCNCFITGCQVAMSA